VYITLYTRYTRATLHTAQFRNAGPLTPRNKCTVYGILAYLMKRQASLGFKMVQSPCVAP
jgi:hypothetical protein